MIFGFAPMLLLSSLTWASTSTPSCQFFDRSTPETKAFMEATPPEGTGIFKCKTGSSQGLFFAFKFEATEDRKLMDLLTQFARKVVEDYTTTVFVEQSGSPGQRRKWILKVERGPDTDPWLFYAFFSPTKAGQTSMYLHYTSSPPEKPSRERIQGQGAYLASHELKQ